MSGKPWTSERKAAWAKIVKAWWKAGVYRRRKRRVCTEAERAASSALMKALNIRMRDDNELKGRCVRGMRRAKRSRAYRDVQAAVMRETMKRPEMRRGARYRIIAMNRNPKMRKRQWAGRRRKKATKK